MGMQARNKKLYAKSEATYGTPVAVTVADAVRTAGLTVTAYAGTRVSRDYDRAGLGSRAQINVAPHAIVSAFSVPFAGSGAKATEPAWADLLLACGCAITDDQTANDAYYFTPIDKGWGSATLVAANELTQQTIAGARGNFSITANPGELPVFAFTNFLGIYQRPVALTLATPNDSAYKDAIPVNSSNTTVLTVGGTAHPVSGFTFDAGLALEWIDQPNRREAVVTDRTPTGTIILTENESAKIIALIESIESHAGESTAAIVLTHGSGDGKTLTLNIYAAQFTDMTEQVVAGETYFSLPFQVLPDSSNDEWRLTQT